MVGIEVYRRRKIEVDAQRRKLPGNIKTFVVGIDRITGGADGEVPGCLRRAPFNVAYPAPLLIGCNKERNTETSTVSFFL